ncbi:amylosucrase [Calothrix rhizosoleniae]|uniref:amylosucrase n=1 Tax=Calothrix rhizosoleniae TaxID=888997 RepID=UPI00190EACFE|nr:amylosucrase [Calothrix rhizosoleniae]
MRESASFAHQSATKSLSRLMPRLEARFAEQVDKGMWQSYVQRLNTHFPHLFNLLYQLYGHQYDFFYHLEDILASATQMWVQRSDELKALDVMREAYPQWYQSQRLVGAMYYVDLFAGNLEGIRKRIPYLTELGITYLHLMPLFKCPEGDNDGGYAVSSYREVNITLGTMEELSELAAELRHHGISLAIDFVFNHTSDEHQWAKLALAGDRECQEYYWMYPNRDIPDIFEKTLTPVFPDDHPGSFTYRNKIRKWVWTSFCNYQWDLNYENPAVFSRMAEEMLFLANVGVEVLRLDAVAFLWKKVGTSCQNLPEAHTIIQAFNVITRIAAPAVIFKSEAIVHPDEVKKYVSQEECQLSYNPQLMALLWNALATREVSLLRHAMEKRFTLPEGCAWVNYIRCHDDIGWAFSDDDARELKFEPYNHRRFLTDFYTGRFEGSFARGLPFQEKEDTGEARISGTTASLCGLEKGLHDNDSTEIEFAIRRILLLHGILLTIGGIPIIYLGDELGTLNDYKYTESPDKDGDTRWVHRPKFDWELAESRWDTESIAGRIYQGLLRLIQIRQQNPAFTLASTDIVHSGNEHVFSYFRHHGEQNVLVLANFSEHEQEIMAKQLRLLGMQKTFTDIVSGKTITATQKLILEPYHFAILMGIR